MYMKKMLFTVLLVIGLGVEINAQTYLEVTEILQTNCATANCHDANTSAAGLNLELAPADLYDLLIDGDPQNNFANQSNWKMVEPGHPSRSYLYRKVNGSLHADSELPPNGAGVTMPVNGDELADAEKELIRQWIYFGAPENSTVVDMTTLEDYYSGNGLDPIAPPAAPEEGEGFQVKFGPFFLEPGEEREWVYKYELFNDSPFEVNRIDLNMDSDFSHHVLLFKNKDGNGINSQGDGLEEVTFTGGQAITNDTKMIGGWAYSKDLVLPAGTAYSWDENTIMKFNYHVKNYSSTSVLPAEVYLNCYTQEPGTAIKEMHSDFFINFSPFAYLLQPGVEKTIPLSVPGQDGGFEAPEAGEPNDVHLWLFGGHTHQWGIDYDAWLVDENGDPGEQIYEGFYDLDYEVNQGFYNYAEPAMRLFEPLLTFDRSQGIYTEGVFLNESNSIVNVGLTTDDEMQGFFCQYIVGDISGLDISSSIDEPQLKSELKIYPNPSSGLFRIGLEDLNPDELNVKIVSPTGAYLRNISLDGNILDLTGMPKGLYLVELNDGTTVKNKKVLIR